MSRSKNHGYGHGWKYSTIEKRLFLRKQKAVWRSFMKRQRYDDLPAKIRAMLT